MTQSATPFIADAHSDFVNRIVEQRRAGGSGAFASEYLPALRAGGVRLVARQSSSDFIHSKTARNTMAFFGSSGQNW